MYKDKVITISDWQKGIADSPVLGFPTVMNCEIFESPGLLKISNRLTPDSSVVASPTGLLIAQVKDPISGSTFSLFNDGKFYSNSTLISSGLSGAQDLVVFKNYVLITWGTSAGNIGYYGPLTTSPALTSGWKTDLPINSYKKMLVGQDDAVYIASGNVLNKLIQNTGSTFDPSNASTYTYSATSSPALDLPEGKYIVTMEELGQFLMLGTTNSPTWSSALTVNGAEIYPWDRVSSSFNRPIKFNENGIQAMKQRANRLYVVAGGRGNVYECDTSNYKKIRRIPFNKNRAFGASVLVYPNAINFSQNDTLVIGTSTSGDAFPSESKHGLYEIYLGEKYPVQFKGVSSGNYGASQSLSVGCIRFDNRDDMYVGWQDGSSYGIDIRDYRMYTSYMAMVETPILKVGSRLETKPFTNIEWECTRPLISGQGIKVEWRPNLSADYTTIGTWDYSTVGSVNSFNDKAKISDGELVQFRISLTQGVSAPFGSNVELLNIRIW